MFPQARIAIQGVVIGGVLDFVFFCLLYAFGVAPTNAVLLAAAPGWIALVSFSGRQAQDFSSSRLLSIAFIALLLAVLRCAVLATILKYAVNSVWAGYLAGWSLAAAFTIALWPWVARSGTLSQVRLLLIVIFYSFLLRLGFIGLLELIPEEAYYWLYASHLSPGYLDHPPMVGWLIAACTAVLGQSELGVRMGAVLCWLIAAFFEFRLTAELFDRRAAVASVFFLSLLPFFAGIGTTIAPDSPLVASWAAALYFLFGALVRGRHRDWYWAGLALGLGLLSKYTIVLLGLATVCFMLCDKSGRANFRRPHPYLGAIIACLIFSPVLYWNAKNGWASFLFQGPRRFEMPAEFALHMLMLDLAILLTPVGIAAIVLLVAKRQPISHNRLFTYLYAFIPVAVFALYSLRHEAKMNWTGPAFLMLLPALGRQLCLWAEDRSRTARTMIRAWVWMTVTCLVTYAAALNYLALGFPFVPYSAKMRRFIGWQDLGVQVHAIANDLQARLGARPVLSGADKHNISSELAFYTYLPCQAEGLPAEQIAGRHLLGLESLMFRFWFNPEVAAGKDLLFVARGISDLDDGVLAPYFSSLEPIQQIQVKRNGKTVGPYYWRLAKEFRTEPRGDPAL